MVLKNFDVNNVAAGREYIEAYVQFFKFAEGEKEGHAEHGTAGDGPCRGCRSHSTYSMDPDRVLFYNHGTVQYFTLQEE